MAAIFKSSLQNLSPLPPRLKVKSTDLAISWTWLCDIFALCTGFFRIINRKKMSVGEGEKVKIKTKSQKYYCTYLLCQ